MASLFGEDYTHSNYKVIFFTANPTKHNVKWEQKPKEVNKSTNNINISIKLSIWPGENWEKQGFDD